MLGGAFAEGVDLPGKRLIGAFIATLGLPQVNPVNENMRRLLDARYGQEHGYDYAYLYPGMQKVVQAAGRVIRTEHDSGTHLIDDRYRRAARAAAGLVDAALSAVGRERCGVLSGRRQWGGVAGRNSASGRLGSRLSW